MIGAGLDHDRPNRLDVAKCFSLPVTLVFLPAADIATYVAEGDVDAGITGLDVVHESNSEVVEILVYIFDMIEKSWLYGNYSIQSFQSLESRYRPVQVMSTSPDSI